MLEKAPEKMGELIETYQFRAYIKELMDLTRFANKYFNDKEPWKSRNENPQDCSNTIHLCLQTVRILGILLEPLIPFTSESLKI